MSQTIGGDYYLLTVLAGLVGAIQGSSGNELVFLDTKAEPPLLQQFHASGCDGLVCVAPALGTIQELRSPAFDKIPMVLLHASDAALRAKGRVCVDIAPDSVGLATRHLASLGHRRVAFFTPDPFNANFKARIDGYRRDVLKYGFSRGRKLFCMIENVPSWYDAARDMARALCLGADRPTAALCTCGAIAHGVWQGIMDAGLKVPEDISIIGFDCEKGVNPHLTTVVQPVYPMAAEAGRLLLAQLGKHGAAAPDVETFFEASLDERGSCSPLNHNGLEVDK